MTKHVHRYIGLLGLIVAALMGGCSQQTNKAPASRFRGEPSPAFRASVLLPAEIVRGHDYTLDESVPVSEYSYMFTIRSRHGVIVARGMDMLELRLREMHAIEAAERLAHSGQFGEGVRSSLQKSAAGLEELATDPGGALARAPKGFGRMLKRSLSSSDERAGDESRRRLAAQLGCDPETKNSVLKKLLDRISLNRQMGSFVVGGVADAVLPGMGLLTTTTDIKEAVENTPLYRINDQIEHELEQMGVERDVRKKFCRAGVYTTMQRLLYMRYLRELRGIPGVAKLPAETVEATNEAETLAVIREMRMLNDLHRDRPISRLEYIGVPLATLADGTAVVVGAADYVTNTQELLDAVKDYRGQHPRTTTFFLTSGRISALAKQTLAEAGIRAVEKGRWAL